MENVYGDFTAALLIDKTISNFAHTKASATGIWIRVKLAKPEAIKKINVYNRIDCCTTRIFELSVYIKLDENIITSCGNFTVDKLVYQFNCDGKGNVVELSAEGQIGAQNIAEIEVYGITGGIYIINLLSNIYPLSSFCMIYLYTGICIKTTKINTTIAFQNLCVRPMLKTQIQQMDGQITEIRLQFCV